jgi:glycine/sarcosine/betaine reductase complex component A
MDLEEQDVVKRTVEEQGLEGVIVILGSPDPESSELFAETVSSGDPTWAGPLAGVSLGLPVYHVTEPEIKAVVDPDVYRDQVELMELALDVESIWSRMADVRKRFGEAES